VGKALLAIQGLAELDPLQPIGNRTVEGLLTGAETKGRDHQPGETEDLVGLVEPLALREPEEVIRRHLDTLHNDLRGIGGADPVLVLGRTDREARGVALDDEERGSARSPHQYSVDLGYAAIGDELLGAVDPVCPDLPFFIEDWLGHRLEASDVRAGLRFGDPIGNDETLLADAPEPVFLLLLGTADDDRVDPETDREKGGGDAEIHPSHLLRHPEDIAAAPAKPPHLLRQEQKVQPELGAEHLVDQLDWKFRLLVQMESSFLVETPLGDRF